MLFVVVNPDVKNSVRAVYHIPEGMDYSDAERIIELVYQDEGIDDHSEALEAQGFRSADWMQVQVMDL